MRTAAAILALTLALGCDDPAPAPLPDAAAGADAPADQSPEAPAAETAAEAPADMTDALPALDTLPAEVAADAPPGDGAPESADTADATADAADVGPRPTSFPARLTNAIWLVGWAGGNEHWSWVRFHLDPGGTTGRWETAPLRCVSTSCVGFFKRPMMWVGCVSREGTFVVEGPNQLRLAVPADCRGTAVGDTQTWDFYDFRTPGSRRLSLESAGVTLGPAVSHIGAHRYPADFCGADLATCAVVPFATSI